MPAFMRSGLLTRDAAFSIMDLFREEVRAHGAALSEGLLALEQDFANTQRIEPLMRAAHSLKGAVANFGAEQVVEKARTLEIMGKSGDLSAADESWRELRSLMDALLPELEAAVAKVTETQVPT